MVRGGRRRTRASEQSDCGTEAASHLSKVSKDRRSAFAKAQLFWPFIELDFEVFEKHLDSLGWTESLPPESKSLYLCLACARGHDPACHELDRRYLKTLRTTLARVVRDPDMVEETLQVVRARLLTGPNARISSYRGQGPLETWLRVVATRIALDELRARKRAIRQELTLAQHYVANQDEELSAESVVFCHAHAPAIRRALQLGLQSLEREDRQLLRLSLVEGLSIDALAERFGIHRSNAARRVARSRKRAFEAVQHELQQELGEVSNEEFASLVGTLYSDLDASLTGLLGKS